MSKNYWELKTWKQRQIADREKDRVTDRFVEPLRLAFDRIINNPGSKTSNVYVIQGYLHKEEYPIESLHQFGTKMRGVSGK